jgi:hypothetical protein
MLYCTGIPPLLKSEAVSNEDSILCLFPNTSMSNQQEYTLKMIWNDGEFVPSREHRGKTTNSVLFLTPTLEQSWQKPIQWPPKIEFYAA